MLEVHRPPPNHVKGEMVAVQTPACPHGLVVTQPGLRSACVPLASVNSIERKIGSQMALGLVIGIAIDVTLLALLASAVKEDTTDENTNP